MPQDAEAVKLFYEGSPRGYPLPWKAWLAPLMAWIPLVQVPLAIIEENDDKPSILMPFYKNG